MEIDSTQQLIIYLVSLQDSLLRSYRDFIDKTSANEYNQKIQELGKALKLELSSYELREEDRYFDPADTGFFRIEGFMPTTDSTSDLSISKIEDKFEKSKLIYKLSMVLYIINEKSK